MAIMIPLAELASIVPTSSGQYHWVWVLAPKNARFSCIYLLMWLLVTVRNEIGWLYVAVWQSIVAMGGILCATLTQGLLVLN
ncbi:hypothetical protein F4802DRAFT_513563 [Xylaria palmicola]|nr:hypothetical protein F4802DRAFT_513563 [Xylaria palmicola]